MKQLLLLSMLATSSVFAQTFTNYTSADGLLSDNVNCLDVASGDVLWFGTQNGVSVFDGSTWTDHTVALDSGLANNTIQAICVTSAGDVWVGTDFGASYFDGNSWTTFTTADGLGNNQIKCIEEDAQGDIWFGTNTGVSEFNGATWMTLGTGDGLPFGGVTAIAFQSNGDVWLGSGLGGIMVYDGTNLTPITSANDGLVDDRVRALLFDLQDQRWVGTSKGISVFDNTNLLSTNYTRIYTMPAPDTLNPIEDIAMDNSGNIWVGVYVDYLVTEGGVCAFDGTDWTEYHVSDGLVGPVIRALTVDSQNNIWIATSTGVSKLSDHQVALNEANDDTWFVGPNPSEGVFQITLKTPLEITSYVNVFSSDMRLVKSEVLTAGAKTLEVSIETEQSGIYFVTLGEAVQRIVKL